MNFLYNLFDNFSNNISDIRNKVNVSFEFFPPKGNICKNSNFLSSIKKLSIFNPNFVSITCTSSKNHGDYYTFNAIQHIAQYFNLNFVPHMTYFNSSIEDIQNLAQNYWNCGIRNIIALRGDIDVNYTSKIYASELIILLKKIADFDISVAAYPEVHPDCQNCYLDIMHLKNKVDCGASRAITQFFFNINNYLKFRDRCVVAGINVEIIPGILPITNFQQIKKFTDMTNVHIPSTINNIFLNLGINNMNINTMVGLIVSINMIYKLYQEGVRNFHFYTLNQFELIYVLCYFLGV